MRRFRWSLVLVMALALTACGSEDEDAAVATESTVATTVAAAPAEVTEAPVGSSETCAVEGRTIETAITAATAMEGGFPDPADRTIAGMLADPFDETRWTYTVTGDSYTLVGIGPCVGNAYPAG